MTALARTGKPPVPLPPLRDTHSALVDALDGGGTVGTEAGAHAFGPSGHIDRVFRYRELVASETAVDSLNTIAALPPRCAADRPPSG